MKKVRALNASQGLCRCGRELDKTCFRCQRMGREKKARQSATSTTKTILAALEILAEVRAQWERTPSIQAFNRWIANTEEELKEKLK